MGRKVRIGLVQMSMSNDRESNMQKALSYVAEAARAGADVVCLPELFSTRYFPFARRATVEPEPIPGKTSRGLAECAKQNRVVIVGGSVFEEAGNSSFNTCLVFDEKGRALSKYRKVHIPQDEHYYEQDYFEPGKGYAVAKTSAGNLGTLICFDQWYSEPARVERLMGAEILYYPTAIGWVKGIEPVEGDW